jgi:hypothetical protein
MGFSSGAAGDPGILEHLDHAPGRSTHRARFRGQRRCRFKADGGYRSVTSLLSETLRSDGSQK